MDEYCSLDWDGSGTVVILISLPVLIPEIQIASGNRICLSAVQVEDRLWHPVKGMWIEKKVSVVSRKV